jgi:hypothetical protein
VNIEQKWWFKSAVSTLMLLTALPLFYWAGEWPFGGRSVAGGVIFFFCLSGLQRLYAGVLGVGVILLAPKLPGVAPKR